MLVASAFSLVLLLQTPPVTAAQQRPPAVGTGSIAGIVVSESGQPLKGARVMASGDSIGRTALTDASGAFLFEKLPEGRYSLSAYRSRYLSSSYGQKRPERTGTLVQLVDGEQLKGLKITLFSAGVITGVVYNDDGEPVQSAQVRALRFVMSTGVRRLQTANVVQTDDRGAYRLFGLLPGEYIVTASSNQSDQADFIFNLPGSPATAAPSSVKFAPTYYPGTVAASSAVTLTVCGGEARSGIDISMQKVQTADVSGTVMTGGGPLPQNVNVTIQPSDDVGQGVNVPSARVGPDGRFSLRAVPPGEYVITARATTTVRRDVPATGPGSLPLGVQSIQMVQTTSTGRAVVSVDGQSLNGLVITLDAGRSLSGRVVFEGGAPPDLSRVRMMAMLQPVQTAVSFNVPSPPPGEVGVDGNFEINGISPGRYILQVNAPMGWTMKSSTVGGRDSRDLPFEVDGDDINGAVVTMELPGPVTELSGLITDTQGKPASDYTIVVFSADQRFWTPGSRRIFTLRPGTDGKYIVRGAPAGDYQIAALSDLEPGTQYDPELLKTLLATSTRVTLGAGAKLTQDLRVKNIGS